MAIDDDRREVRAEHDLCIDTECPAERAVHEREPAVHVRTADDVALAVEKIAIARFVVAQLPLEVLELLEPWMRDCVMIRLLPAATSLVAQGALRDALGDTRTLQEAREPAQHDRAIVNGEGAPPVVCSAARRAFAGHAFGAGRRHCLVVFIVAVGHRTLTPRMSLLLNAIQPQGPLLNDYALGLQ